MKVTPTAIPDVLVVEPWMFGDYRDFFYLGFSQESHRLDKGALVEGGTPGTILIRPKEGAEERHDACLKGAF